MRNPYLVYACFMQALYTKNQDLYKKNVMSNILKNLQNEIENSCKF